MAGVKGRSGRRPIPGKLYHLYVRFNPAKHPPELKDALDRIEAARGQERQQLIIDALLRKSSQDDERARPESVEGIEVTDIMNEMFGI